MFENSKFGIENAQIPMLVWGSSTITYNFFLTKPIIF